MLTNPYWMANVCSMPSVLLPMYVEINGTRSNRIEYAWMHTVGRHYKSTGKKISAVKMNIPFDEF